MKPRHSILLSGLLLFGTLEPARGAEVPAPTGTYPAIVTDPAAAGPDYAFVGEYTGRVTGGYRPAPVGVQIYGIGENRLASVEYAGGLPGAGWDGSPKRRATGFHRGVLARMESAEHQVVIIGDRLWLRDHRGVLRGMLHRVRRGGATHSDGPPPEAIVLFNGHETGELEGARVTEDGLLAEGARTVREFQDFFLHVEFRLPYMSRATGQGRANSGVYLQERYEVQILDSFGLDGELNECGALYQTVPPSVHMCLPPLVWQTYDIEFRAARFDAAGQKLESALLTVRHNGVLVHHRLKIPNKTGNGKPEGPEPRPIVFQNHSNPVRFRNLWIIDRTAQQFGTPEGVFSPSETMPEMETIETVSPPPLAVTGRP